MGSSQGVGNEREFVRFPLYDVTASTAAYLELIGSEL